MERDESEVAEDERTVGSQEEKRQAPACEGEVEDEEDRWWYCWHLTKEVDLKHSHKGKGLPWERTGVSDSR